MRDLSVIIVNYNTKELTLACIESVLKYSTGINLEIVVVDNASKDGSKKALRKAWKEHREIVLVENKKNLGFAKANNQGIESSKGEYVFLLNSDTEVKKDSLKKLLEFSKKTKDAGVVSARLLNPDGSIQESCFNFPTIGNAASEYWLGKKGAYSKFAPKGKTPVQIDVCAFAAVLLTPEALNTVGGLEEKYFMYYEDFDYCRRTYEFGLKVYYLPKAEIIHYHGSSGKKIAKDKDQWRRLIPSSKLYHGLFRHYLLYFILWSGQKGQKLFH